MENEDFQKIKDFANATGAEKFNIEMLQKCVLEGKAPSDLYKAIVAICVKLETDEEYVQRWVRNFVACVMVSANEMVEKAGTQNFDLSSVHTIAAFAANEFIESLKVSPRAPFGWSWYDPNSSKK